MLNKIVHRVSRRHHPWRAMQFDELAEVYTSMTLRSFGFGIIGIFVPVYLYENGASIQSIMLFYASFFIIRIPLSILTAHLVGRIGPKHTIAISTVFIISFFGMLLTYDSFAWPLWTLSVVFGIANTLFFIGYNIDFSKIKHTNHGGKELGWLYIFERFGAAIGPLIGGLLAGFTEPEIAIAFAMVVLIASILPLFLTNEPIKTHQSISFKGFRWRPHLRDYTAMSLMNIQTLVNGVIWPLLLAIAVFQDDTYTKLGGLFAISMLVSMFSARMFGRFIDGNKGLSLLRYGTFMGTIMTGLKGITNAPSGALAVSTLGEPAVLAYRMPLTKGLYDKAGDVEKNRIVYIVAYEIAVAVAKATLCLVAYALVYVYGPINGLRLTFGVVALLTPLMLLQKFPALKQK